MNYNLPENSMSDGEGFGNVPGDGKPSDSGNLPSSGNPLGGGNMSGGGNPSGSGNMSGGGSGSAGGTGADSQGNADADVPRWQTEFAAKKKDGKYLTIKMDAPITRPADEGMVEVVADYIPLDSDFLNQAAGVFFGDQAKGKASGTSYVGEIKGSSYVLKFRDGRLRFYPKDYAKAAYGMVRDLNDVATGECGSWEERQEWLRTLGDSYQLSFMEDTKNHARISQKEGQEMAEKLLENLGLTGIVYRGWENLYWVGHPDTYVPDNNKKPEEMVFGVDYASNYYGYNYFFSWGTEAISFSEFQENPSCGAVVAVTDEGVVKCTVNCPISVTKISENVSLLPVEEIEDILQKAISEEPERFVEEQYRSRKTVVYRKMDLIYYYRPGPDNICRFTPVWRVTGYEGMLYQNEIYVNALDGSILKPAEGIDY